MIVKTAATAAVATGLVFGGAVGAQAIDTDSLEVEHFETVEQKESALNYPVMFTLSGGAEITIETDDELESALEDYPELSEIVLAQVEDPSIMLLLLEEEGTEPVAPLDPEPEPQPDPEPVPEPEPEPETPIAPIPDPDPEPKPEPTPTPAPVDPGIPVTPAPEPVVNPNVGYTVQPVASTTASVRADTPTQLAYTGAASTAGVAAAAAVALLGGGAAMLFRNKRRASAAD